MQNMGNEKIYTQIMNKCGYDELNLVKCASSYNFKNKVIFKYTYKINFGLIKPFKREQY